MRRHHITALNASFHIAMIAQYKYLIDMGTSMLKLTLQGEFQVIFFVFVIFMWLVHSMLPCALTIDLLLHQDGV